MGDTSTPPRTHQLRKQQPSTSASASPELPAEFRDQAARHKAYKRRGPPSGSRFTEEDIGETRATLSSRFLGAAGDAQPTSSAPPPPPPPPPPAGASRASFPKLPKNAQEERRRTAATAAAAPQSSTVTATAAATTATSTLPTTEAGAHSRDAAAAPTVVEPPAFKTGTAATTKRGSGSDSGAAGTSASPGGKRKAAPETAEQKENESLREAAAVVSEGVGEEDRLGVEAEAVTSRPAPQEEGQKESEGGEGVEAEKSVQGGAENGGRPKKPTRT